MGRIHAEGRGVCIWYIKTLISNASFPIPIHSIDDVDQIWKTCCALHNWLLKIDGLDQDWVDVPNEGSTNDARPEIQIPLQRLSHSMRDLSQRQQSVDAPTALAETGTNVIDQDRVNAVRLLSRQAFQVKLVIHLNIAFSKLKS